ncbi:hypothetical protein ACNKHU_24700 [Shigella flexneri]
MTSIKKMLRREPLFSNFGGRASFGGIIITVKCFEDNGLLYDLLDRWPWSCSRRRWRWFCSSRMVDAELARLAVQNEWQGLVIYGAVRQVDDLEELDIGIQAMAAIPVGAAGEGIGESDVRVKFGGVTFFPATIFMPTIPGSFFQKIRWIRMIRKALQGAFFLRYLLAYK